MEDLVLYELDNGVMTEGGLGFFVRSVATVVPKCQSECQFNVYLLQAPTWMYLN